MAFFGESTGYPALRVTVGDAGQMNQDMDYLVLGTATDQPAFQNLNPKLSVAINSDGISIQQTSNFYSRVRHAWWKVAQLRPNWWWQALHGTNSKGLIAEQGQTPDAVLQGIESPAKSGRSVVAIAISDSEDAGSFTNAFLTASASSAIAQAVSVLHGSEFSSYRLDENFYRIGSLPWYAQVRYYLLAYPWLIVLFTFLLGLFVVPWIRARLDQRSNERLGTKI